MLPWSLVSYLLRDTLRKLNLTDGRDKEYKPTKGAACECPKRQDAFTVCKAKNRSVRKESYHSF